MNDTLTDDQLTQLKGRISRLSNQDLLQIIFNATDYHPQAVAYAKAEANWRGLGESDQARESLRA